MAGEDMFRQCAVVELIVKEEISASDLHAGLQRGCSDACLGLNAVEPQTSTVRYVKLGMVILGRVHSRVKCPQLRFHILLPLQSVCCWDQPTVRDGQTSGIFTERST
jgi:hypothetical protein